MTHEQPGTVEKFTLMGSPAFIAKDTPPKIKGKVFFDRDFMTKANIELLIQSDKDFYGDNELLLDPQFIEDGYCSLEIIELLSERGELPGDIIYVPSAVFYPLESYICSKISQLRAVLSFGGILSHSAINVRETAKQYGGDRRNFALLFCVETDLLQSQDQVEIDLSNPHDSSITVTRVPRTD